jgi:hypothetical protein
MESSSRPPEVLQSRKPLSRLPYAIAAASFIPFVGVLFGTIAIILGTARRMWGAVGLGVFGLLFNLIVYFGLFHNGGIYGKMRAMLAVEALKSAVKDIEVYKQQHGRYPALLSEVEPPNDKKRLNNFIDPVIHTKDSAGLNGRFYYHLDPSGKFYLLRSVGPDGIPFTGDDILPALSEEERKSSGLRPQQ